MTSILSVSQATQRIRSVLNQHIPYIWVQGELTNLTKPRSGHVYFSLKDEQALIQGVWFKQHQTHGKFDPLTGEVYEDNQPNLVELLQEGMQVICAGQLGVYGPAGTYQILVEHLQVQGEGQLALAFETLRRKLELEGFFRLERKRSLPPHPQRVSVLTALSGAVIHDFLRLAEVRGVGFKVRVQAVAVQGEEAPLSIAQALELENELAWADVIVLIRGGGSTQDLQAFNTELVARAIFNSQIPVLAGIGHEVDTSLADLTADVRAATPSHAVTILWPERNWYVQQIDGLELKLQQLMQVKLNRVIENLNRNLDNLHKVSPKQKLAQLQVVVQHLQPRLQQAWEKQFRASEYQLGLLQNKLTALNPELPLQQGYIYALAQGEVVSRMQDLQAGQTLQLHWLDGQVAVQVLSLPNAP